MSRLPASMNPRDTRYYVLPLPEAKEAAAAVESGVRGWCFNCSSRLTSFFMAFWVFCWVVSSLIQLINCITWLNPTKKKNTKAERYFKLHCALSSKPPFPSAFLQPFLLCSMLVSHFSLNCLATNLIKKFLHHFIPFLSPLPLLFFAFSSNASRLCCFPSAY